MPIKNLQIVYEKTFDKKSDAVSRRIARKRTTVRDERSNAENASLFLLKE